MSEQSKLRPVAELNDGHRFLLHEVYDKHLVKKDYLVEPTASEQDIKLGLELEQYGYLSKKSFLGDTFMVLTPQGLANWIEYINTRTAERSRGADVSGAGTRTPLDYTMTIQQNKHRPRVSEPAKLQILDMMKIEPKHLELDEGVTDGSHPTPNAVSFLNKSIAKAFGMTPAAVATELENRGVFSNETNVATIAATTLTNGYTTGSSCAPTPPSVPEAMKVVKQALYSDPDYVWSWHCNLVMSYTDAGGTRQAAMEASRRFLSNLANVDISKDKRYSDEMAALQHQQGGGLRGEIPEPAIGKTFKTRIDEKFFEGLIVPPAGPSRYTARHEGRLVDAAENKGALRSGSDKFLIQIRQLSK